MTAKERYMNVAAELADECVKAGRDPQDVTLIAVSKTVGVAEVERAIEGGAHDFGENRPDQLMLKADSLPQERWHFIGNIQSRRIKDIVGRAVLVHSLYQEGHARKIDQVAEQLGIVQDVLLEVNVSGEKSKDGLAPDQVSEFLTMCGSLPHVRVRGLMTMAPRGDEDVARQTFAGLARLLAQLKSQLPAEQAECFTELSMGMSEDWREAVAEGATYVRIGRAVFSDQF